MSPTAFQHQITDLVSHLLRCRELCDSIVANRHIGREHVNLDNVRAALKTCSNSVWFEFNALKNLLGSRMELGDETARYSLSYNIRDLHSGVESRLRDIALRRIDGPPGFKDILRKVERIEEKVKTVMIDLARRLGAPIPAPIRLPVEQSLSILAPLPARQISTRTKKVVSFVEEKPRNHLMDCWEERNVGDRILYVNCYDETKMQWTRPSGYIKRLPIPVVVRRASPPVWRQPPPPVRRDPAVQYRIV